MAKFNACPTLYIRGNKVELKYTNVVVLVLLSIFFLLSGIVPLAITSHEACGGYQLEAFLITAGTTVTDTFSIVTLCL